MKKYLAYKNKIKGFHDVEDTVRTVEKVAASHIHFLKKRVSVLVDYKKEVELVMSRLTKFKHNGEHPLLKKRMYGEKALFLVAGDKGIVGGLYHDLINKFLEQKREYKYIWILGNKGKEYLEEEGVRARQFFYNYDGLPNPTEIKRISSDFFSLFQGDILRSVDILYPSFISIAEQSPKIVEFLPFNFQNDEMGGGQNTQEAPAGEGMPIFEPSKKSVFDILLKKYINIFLTQIIFEAKLSEFSARTVAAEHAASKTQDIIIDLNLSFLKERKRSMTQKQLESFIVHQIL